MRLIDADRLKLVFEKNVVSADIFNSLIDAQPTVDAIPIEWIEKYISEIEDDVPNVAGAFKGLIEIWRAEQESHNDNN